MSKVSLPSLNVAPTQRVFIRIVSGLMIIFAISLTIKEVAGTGNANQYSKAHTCQNGSSTANCVLVGPAVITSVSQYNPTKNAQSQIVEVLFGPSASEGGGQPYDGTFDPQPSLQVNQQVNVKIWDGKIAEIRTDSETLVSQNITKLSDLLLISLFSFIFMVGGIVLILATRKPPSNQYKP